MFLLRFALLSAILLPTCLLGCTVYHQVGGTASLAGVEDELDKWLGRTKEEQFQAMGDPERCMMGPQGREFCQWVHPDDHPKGSSVTKRVFVYDQKGIICGWTYTGQWANQSKDRC